jgi:hypothetical protein
MPARRHRSNPKAPAPTGTSPLCPHSFAGHPGASADASNPCLSPLQSAGPTTPIRRATPVGLIHPHPTSEKQPINTP